MPLLSAQRVLAFTPQFNTPGKRDVTGAFLPEARAFVRLAQKGSELVAIDNRKAVPARRKQVLAAIEARSGKGFTSVAFFCHGLRSSIQLGFRSLLAPQLAAAVTHLTDGAEDVVVPLYCCSTGADHDGDALGAPGTGDHSFADRLRDALCAAGAPHCRVTAHALKACDRPERGSRRPGAVRPGQQHRRREGEATSRKHRESALSLSNAVLGLTQCYVRPERRVTSAIRCAQRAC